MLVIGPAEAGKTTFTARLANLLHARGLKVAVVDADVGQSEIGPPAAVGLGAVRAPLTRTGDAELVAFEFIGVTSPGRQPWRTAEATGRLVARARAQFDRVIVDTSGFVDGGFAAALKQRKIAATDPDVVVTIQVGDETEHIVRPLGTRDRPRVVRLPAVGGGTPRNVTTRRRHRDAALARHLDGARTVTLEAARVPIRSLRGDSVPLEQIVPGTLVALNDAEGHACALGVVERADAAEGTLSVRTTCARDAITTVTLGEMTVA